MTDTRTMNDVKDVLKSITVDDAYRFIGKVVVWGTISKIIFRVVRS